MGRTRSTASSVRFTPLPHGALIASVVSSGMGWKSREHSIAARIAPSNQASADCAIAREGIMGFDKREVSYTQARNDLMRTIRDEFITDLPEHDRGERVAELVRELSDQYPDLDDQMSRRLMGEAMRADDYRDPV